MHCWARYFLIATVSVLGIGQMIAACGQTGDLYLPKKKPAAQETASAAAEVPPPADPKAQQGQ